MLCVPKFLEPAEVAEVMASPEPRNLIIGGSADLIEGIVVLIRGDFTSVLVPFDWFEPSGTTEPDFTDFEVIDYGQTVRFGGYEAATEAILEAVG